MTDLLRVQYAQTGNSSRLDEMGMREMQARAYAARNAQYLLLKSPPASGKSRALMFLGLDKLEHQGIKKVIVAVPEMSIGASFRDTNLKEHGFFANWAVVPHNNLCLPGGDAGKTIAFQRFMASDEPILICTHATLRFAFDKQPITDFNDTLIAIDEFHHVSVDDENRLGNLIDDLIKYSTAHIIAMTGSYFRGDAVPILLPEDESKFTKVTYTYYEQLNGYQYLKSLGIGYHFYQGSYLNAAAKVLDTHKKTIVHIPNVNSGESTKDKYSEVDHILDIIGEVVEQDPRTGIMKVTTKEGRQLKVANLVDDNPAQRQLVVAYLRGITHADDMDVIIALGMAKEGFDWPWCEHVLTIGYRSSMTEIVQIIGRATRDAEGKSHAQFTNLIAQPDAEDEDVKVSVNNMLKAITVSLLMEQILAPSINFRPRSRLTPDERPAPGTIIIDDSTIPVSDRVLEILNTGADDIKATLIMAPKVKESLAGGVPPEVINEGVLPKIIQTLYPDLSTDEVNQVREGVLTGILINTTGGLWNEADLPQDADIDDTPPSDADGSTHTESSEQGSDSARPETRNRQFIQMGSRFINIENLNIELIEQVNPFCGAYEILSKSVTAPMLKTIQEVVSAGRLQMSDEEALILWPKIVAFRQEHGREPSLSASNTIEVRLAEGLVYIKRRKQEKQQA